MKTHNRVGSLLVQKHAKLYGCRTDLYNALVDGWERTCEKWNILLHDAQIELILCNIYGITQYTTSAFFCVLSFTSVCKVKGDKSSCSYLLNRCPLCLFLFILL